MKQLAFINTVRGRLLLLAIGVELLLLTVLVANSARLLYGAMSEQAAWQARQIAPVLNAALTAPLAQRDFATLQAVLDESRATEELIYLEVIDRSGNRVASSGNLATAGSVTVADGSKVTFRRHTLLPQYDSAVPITLGGQRLGQLNFGLSLTRVDQARKELLAQSIGIAVVELILSSLVLTLVGYLLTRHLGELTRASLAVAGGNMSPTMLPEGNDDIGRLGAAFNAMSHAIAERVAELDRQKTLLTVTIDSIIDIMFFKNLQGVYLGCNPAFSELVGMQREKIIGHTDYDLFEHSVADFFREQDRQMLVSGLSRTNEEWVTYPDGRRVLLETKKSPLRSPGGEIIGLIGISRDVTERREMESALHEQAIRLEQEVADRQRAEELLQIHAGDLEALNRSLEARVQEELWKNREKDSILLQQDKLASIGQLAAGVAHEINNPMGFVMSNLGTLDKYLDALGQYIQFNSMLHDRLLSDKDKQQAAAEAERLDIPFILEDMPVLVRESLEGADRVKRIVLDLKDYARVDENRFKQASLNDLVKSTITIVHNELKYVARLDLQLGELPLIYCIPQQINQVLTNLLMNAAQAIEKQGVITVRTHAEHEQICLEVQDTGCGMSEKTIKKIFEPFFTTKDVGKGTGLGLAICYDIVQKHHGRINVESALGDGTTFRIWLPIAGDGVANTELDT